MVLFTKDNGQRMDYVMGEECRSGKMDLSTKGNGKKTWQMGKDDSFTQTEMFM